MEIRHCEHIRYAQCKLREAISKSSRGLLRRWSRHLHLRAVQVYEREEHSLYSTIGSQ